MSQSEQSVSFQKNFLREKIKKLKISATVRRSRSLRLNSKIETSHFFRNSNSIGLYSALPDEIDVFPLARKALESGRKVFFPRMNGKKIEFREVADLKKDLKPGRYGIFEPIVTRTKKRARALDLILVPGRAFDKQGRRLGRGAGYYDRLLSKWSDSVRMGVAFREQILKRIPHELHDVDMDIVLTA